MRHSRHAILASGTALIALIAGAAHAQSEPPPPVPTASPNALATDTGIPEIIVTAQRREERLQTVPIAVTALTGATLEQAGIRDITRLEVLTPGLSVGQTGSDSRPALRGVNTDNSRQAQADSAVAFFVDGIYSRLCALEGFAGHGEQANLRVRRYGGRNIPYAGRAEPVEHAAG